MKFNWGTGIFIFLILFLLACGLFIGFAMRQEISLEHEDYYERGVDHSDQMNVKARSAQFQNAIRTRVESGNLLVIIDSSLAVHMDSPRMHLYRPSDSKQDIQGTFEASDRGFTIPADELSSGRYILKVFWTASASDTGGLKYEVDQTVFIP